MRKRTQIPIALTIAGSDSGGGAGIQADLKTFASLGVHGTSAITCLTAQNPRCVSGILPCTPAMVRKQIDAVFYELRPAAVKTGMLYSKEVIHLVSGYFARHARPPLIVDPVMIATSGAQLLKPSAINALRDELLRRAVLVTPNLPEAELLAGRKIRSVEDMRNVARLIYDRYGCAALVKGGHLRGHKEAVDIFYDGTTELLLTAPFIRGVHPHGTGCTYSAAIVAFLARKQPLHKAVALAKQYITDGIANGLMAANHFVLNTFAKNIA